MTVTDEQLVAYMDGELSDAEMNDIERLMENDSSLIERMETLQSADAFLTDAFKAVDDRPIRQETLDLIAKQEGTEVASNVVSLNTSKKDKGPVSSTSWWQQAIAAGLLLFVGFGAGTQFQPQVEEEEEDYSAHIAMGDPLYEMLEAGPSMEKVQLTSQQTVSAMPLLSFLDTSGTYCRQYEVRLEASVLLGVACRDNSAWRVRTLLETEIPDRGQGDSYITASSEEAHYMDGLIAKMMIGDALSPDDEKRLIQQSWKE